MGWMPPSFSSSLSRSGVRSWPSSVNEPMLYLYRVARDPRTLGTVWVPKVRRSSKIPGLGRTIAAVLAALALAAAAAPAGHAQSDPGCVGDTDASAVPQKPGPRLRFGIGPLVQAGQIGPSPAAAVPEQPTATHDALAQLRPPSGPFVLRLNRLFWSDGEEGVRRYLALARRFTSRGYLVELQLRYHPSPQQEGDIAAWTRYVREVVRRFAVNQGVVAIQVTNEVNFTISADSSDGAYDGARQALVDGVIAAKDELRRLGRTGQIKIGFNWAYRLDPRGGAGLWDG